uniref:Proton_antipo_M domain-containing protein n=1 Tax=Angiostrongylus cantonensis TaxID=6313 RepID=A0A0K0D5Q1_ANGCA
MILSSFIHYQPLTYQDYEFSPFANLLGIFFALSAASAIPLVSLYKLFNAKGSTFKEKFKQTLMPYRCRPSQNEYAPIGGVHASDILL